MAMEEPPAAVTAVAGHKPQEPGSWPRLMVASKCLASLEENLQLDKSGDLQHLQLICTCSFTYLNYLELFCIYDIPLSLCMCVSFSLSLPVSLFLSLSLSLLHMFVEPFVSVLMPSHRHVCKQNALWKMLKSRCILYLPHPGEL